jgi:hypothetical protein
MSAGLDNEVRLHVYRRFIAQGRPPTVADVGQALDIGEAEAGAAFRRLEADHVLVLAPGRLDVWMANPLCAVPTSFWVTTASGSWWGTCIWDALGIPAMLGVDGVIETTCPDCSEPIELSVEDGALRPAEGVAHFVVPAARGWENIGFT